MKTNDNILNNLPDTFKDKLKGLGVRKTSILIRQLVKQYRIMWNALSEDGRKLLSSSPPARLDEYNNDDRLIVERFEKEMAEWLE